MENNKTILRLANISKNINGSNKVLINRIAAIKSIRVSTYGGNKYKTDMTLVFDNEVTLPAIYFGKVTDKQLKHDIINIQNGMISDYNGSPQVKLNSFLTFSMDEIKMKNIEITFTRKNHTDLFILTDKLKSIIEEIQDEKLRELCRELTLNNEQFITAPAAVAYHHNEKNGLLIHTIEVEEYAKAIYDKTVYFGTLFTKEEINRDIVIAGALLHDIGKAKIYKCELLNATLDNILMLEDHICLGLEEFIEKSKKYNLDSYTEKMIRHIIISHHGTLEFGSPVAPRTVEAKIVNYADTISSKLNAIKNNMDASQGENIFTSVTDQGRILMPNTINKDLW